MSGFYTYLYIDPITNTPKYVGKGKGNRYIFHMRYTKHTNKYLGNWLNKLKNENIQPTIKFLVKDCDEELAFFVEQEAIKKYGRLDLGTGTLFNFTDGGEGISGLPMSEQQKKKISELAKKRKNMLGKKHTQKTKEKISVSALNRNYSYLHKKVMSPDGIFNSLTEMSKFYKKSNGWATKQLKDKPSLYYII